MPTIYRVQPGESTIDKVTGTTTERYQVFKMSTDFEVGGIYNVHQNFKDGKEAIYCDCPSVARPCKHAKLVQVVKGCYPTEELASKFWTMKPFGVDIKEWIESND